MMDTGIGSTHRWNRTILNICWLLVLLTILVEIAILIADKLNGRLDPYWPVTVLIPGIAVIALLTITELLVSRSKYQDYAVLVLMLLSMSSFCFFFWDVQGVQYVLVLPIIVSAIYYQWIKIALAYGGALIALVLLFLFHERLRAVIEMPAFVLTLLFYSAAALLVYIIIGRNQEILSRLHKEMEERQMLLVDNVIKDRMMKIDGLTQLYNRRSFQEYAETLTKEADSGAFSFALGLFDIDNFKSINDTFGHLVGDIAIQRIAAAGQAVFGPNDFLCRYGGEEFAVLIILEDGRDLAASLERMRLEVERSALAELGSRRLTISGGASVYVPGQGLESLIRVTDALLYEAKREGKNRVKVDGKITIGMLRAVK